MIRFPRFLVIVDTSRRAGTRSRFPYAQNVLLLHSASFLGARDERKYQRPDPSVRPQAPA